MATSGPFMLATVGCPCCAAGTLSCSPCDIPADNLTLSWTNIISGPGSTTLIYSSVGGGQWTTGCVNNLIYNLICTGGQVDFQVIYFISGTCPTGQRNQCTSLATSPFGLTLVSHTCSPFSMTWTTVPNCPNVEAAGYINFTITYP